MKRIALMSTLLLVLAVQVSFGDTVNDYLQVNAGTDDQTDLLIQGLHGTPTFQILRDAGPWGKGSVKVLVDGNSDANIRVSDEGTGTPANFHISTGGSRRFTITKGGNVAIGTTSIDSQYKLSVGGKVRAEEIVVETGWADFVFEDDYRLMPLNEVEQHIKDKGHLPDIPSASEVAENGVSVGEMQAKLLQKVEELTLHMIELKKENEQLKARVASLEN